MTKVLEDMLNDERFWALERRVELIFGEWLPKKNGDPGGGGREIIGREVYYAFGWIVELGRVRWVKVKKLEEIPCKVANCDWM